MKNGQFEFSPTLMADFGVAPFGMKGSFLLQLAYIIFIPGFFLGFTILYNPFDIQGWYSFGSFTFGFHLVMISCIALVCLLISRLILFATLKNTTLKWWHYLVWCFCELGIISAFAALYTVLFTNQYGVYFFVLQVCIKYVYLILCQPYILLTLLRIIRLKNEEIAHMNEAEDNSLIRFYDEHKRLKLTIAPAAIIYVKSDFNYVKINYIDAGKLKEFSLRASMRSIEESGIRCLVRCQRSYFVNPDHVSVLRKGSDGIIYAEVNIPDVPPVPVSKQYYDSLSALL